MKAIPEPSRRRLVLLERLLSTFADKNITSQRIEELTGWSAAVVRRDISLLELNAGASNGYKVSELKAALDAMLDLSPPKPHACCIVGLSKMGQALLDNKELYDSAFKIVAGFDSSVNRTEILRSSFPLHPTTMLEQVIKDENIRYAILTVDPTEAQSISIRLADCGIRGIVNYTPCVLSVPPSTKVENVSLLTSLENLSAMTADGMINTGK